MKTFYGLGKPYPSGRVLFLKGKVYKSDDCVGLYEDEAGNWWSLRGMMTNVKRGFISDKLSMEENE